MKIAFFHELPPGGARNAVNAIAAELKKRNIVDLYFVDERENQDEKKFFTQTFFYQFKPKIWHGKNWRVRLYKDTIELYKLAKEHKNIATNIRKRKYDFVFVNASKYIESPFILRYQLGLKVFYLHDPHYRVLYENSLTSKKFAGISRTLYQDVINFMKAKVDKKNLDGADVYLANSEFTKKVFLNTYGKHSTVSYLGVDTIFFSPKKAKKKYDILFIGSREPVDGYDLLQRVIKEMSPKPKVKTVLFDREWLTSKEIRNLYRESKLVVCLAKSEPFGMVPLEAMAIEVPVVAVNEGGYKETIVHGKTGFLLERDVDVLADKLDYLLVHPEIIRKMGRNARVHTVQNWTWEKRIIELENLFKKFIKL